MHAIQQLMTWSCLFNSIGIHIHTIDCEGLHLLIWTNLNKDIFLLVLQLFINTEIFTWCRDLRLYRQRFLHQVKIFVLQLFINTEIFTWCRNLCLYSLNIEDWISLVINLTITVYGQIENKLFKNWLLKPFYSKWQDFIYFCLVDHWLLYFTGITSRFLCFSWKDYFTE